MKKVTTNLTKQLFAYQLFIFIIKEVRKYNSHTQRINYLKVFKTQ